MMRALIVDDELIGRVRIRQLLADHRDVTVIGECDNGVAAVAAIRRLNPHLVFLDIHMPEMDGFGVLRAVGRSSPLPAVIFITAHDEYALRAFEVHVVDYVVKPVNEERFAVALERARRAVSVRAEPPLDAIDDTRARVAALIAELQPSSESDTTRCRTRVAVRRAGRHVTFVSVDAIDWIEAMGNYVRVHAGQQVHVIPGTLARIVRQLPPDAYLRIHRSAVVRVERIEEVTFEPRGRCIVRLASGAKLSVGRRYRAGLDTFVQKC